MTTQTHFTAWLVNDSSCLDQENCDLTVLQDTLISGDPESAGSWGTDSSKPQAFYGVTSVSAKDSDIDAALVEAEVMLRDAGWRTVGAWDVVPNAYTITVEREV